MKNLFPAALVLASFALVPASAFALPLGETFDISLDRGTPYGVQEYPVGTWRILPTFPTDVTDPTTYAEACQYIVKWTNYSYLPSTTNLYLNELEADGLNDCDDAGSGFVTSEILLAPGPANKGFDVGQIKQTVNFLSVGEQYGSKDLYGTIVLNYGAVYSLVAKGY